MTSPLALEVGKNGRNYKMPKCPHCGSTAQVRLLDSDFSLESDTELVYIRDYKCGCGTYFQTAVTYITYDDEEVIREERL